MSIENQIFAQYFENKRKALKRKMSEPVYKLKLIFKVFGYKIVIFKKLRKYDR
tara:strand:+ start:491 stop:649 length:159 start_codon:yes stop_codon:yes gene_type:complete